LTPDERRKELERYRESLKRMKATPVVDRVGQVWELPNGGRTLGIVLQSYPGVRSDGSVVYYHCYQVIHSDTCSPNVGKRWSICEDEMQHPDSARIL
jgi:hypothetical protein